MEYQELIDSYGISRGTIDCGLHKFRKRQSSSWASIKDPLDNRKQLIVYRTIPAHSRKHLPSEQELIMMCKMQDSDLQNIYNLLNNQNFD